MLRQYPPLTGKHPEHLSHGYVCDNCHYNYFNDPGHRNGVNDASDSGNVVFFDGLNPSGVWDNGAGSCSSIECHKSASWSVPWYNTTSNGCRGCHAEGSSIDPLATNGSGTSGKHLVHDEGKGFTCENCHYGYTEKPGHLNGTYGKDETASIVNFGGMYGDVQASGSFNDSTGACNSISCHGYASGTLWYGEESPTAENIENKTNGCYSCHGTGSEYDPVSIDSAAGMGRHAKHSGIYCGKCHSGYGTAGTHKNGIFDHESSSVQAVIFDSSNTGGQWMNDTGAGTGTCASLACHPSATLDWYASASYTLPACPDCHKNSVGSRRQVFDSNGDGSGTGGDFNQTSHHVINYSNKTQQIVTAADCEACHDQAKHMSGLIRLKDYNNPGVIVVYNPGTPSSAEAFCLGCHDTDGANGNMSPLSSGNTLGSGSNIAGSKIKSSWNMQYGHRREGLTCLGTGAPGTGCHGNYNTSTGTGSINAHGSGNAGLLSNKMVLPVPDATWDETRYKLCLDCHNNYPDILNIEGLVRVAPGGNYAQSEPPGYSYTQFPNQTGFVTNGFHDYRSKNYDKQQNLHLYHLQTPNWYYRGTTASTQSCVTCHNVHGVNGRYFYLWDEWRFSIETDNGIEYGKLVSAYFINKEYPEFCSDSCHFLFDKTYRYPRGSLNEAYAYANISSGPLAAGDTVTVLFSNPTNGLSIVTGNGSTGPDFGIDLVLPLNNTHKWGTINAVWSDSNKRLTITIITPDALPVTVDDIITIAVYSNYTKNAWSILDLNGNTYRGKMTLKGSN